MLQTRKLRHDSYCSLFLQSQDSTQTHSLSQEPKPQLQLCDSHAERARPWPPSLWPSGIQAFGDRAVRQGRMVASQRGPRLHRDLEFGSRFGGWEDRGWVGGQGPLQGPFLWGKDAWCPEIGSCQQRSGPRSSRLFLACWLCWTSTAGDHGPPLSTTEKTAYAGGPAGSWGRGDGQRTVLHSDTTASWGSSLSHRRL